MNIRRTFRFIFIVILIFTIPLNFYYIYNNYDSRKKIELAINIFNENLDASDFVLKSVGNKEECVKMFQLTVNNSKTSLLYLGYEIKDYNKNILIVLMLIGTNMAFVLTFLYLKRSN